MPAPAQAFATYLLIAWLTTNIIFAQIVNILSALEWEVGPAGQAGCMSKQWGRHMPAPQPLATS